MRIDKIKLDNVPPVQSFDVSGLSDLVVIAGPNGVGKSRLIAAMLQYFRTFTQPSTTFEIVATNQEESAAWGKGRLVTSNSADAQKLKLLLQKQQRRRNLKSSIIYYESDRSIQKVNPLQFQWEFADPWEEQLQEGFSFSPLKSRWQDTIHAIFKKIQSQKSSIASRAIQLKSEGKDSMSLEFSDPLDPFRDAFSKLLAPKRLIGVDVRKQTLLYAEGDREDDVKSLSSGEREVLNIIFDFILRKPSDCVVFFDEPELHLHPELLHKLITTLRSVGRNNQFILISHSPSVISASLEDSVIFLTPPKIDGSNQAVVVRPDDSTSTALHKLGQSIGIVALGHKIALIEGNDASLDKQTYGQILKNRHPGIVLQPVGGKDQLISFEAILDDVLNRAIWGVDFYMLADRDAGPIGNTRHEMSQRSGVKIQELQRYHLENYFLDAGVLASCFEDQEPPSSWLRDGAAIGERLAEIAASFLSYAAALIVSKHIRMSVGNVSLMPRGCVNKSEDELTAMVIQVLASERIRVASALEDTLAQSLIGSTFKQLQESLRAGGWIGEIPGKPILAKFAATAQIPLGRLKSLYIAKNAEKQAGAFTEIEEVFKRWAG